MKNSKKSKIMKSTMKAMTATPTSTTTHGTTTQHTTHGTTTATTTHGTTHGTPTATTIHGTTSGTTTQHTTHGTTTMTSTTTQHTTHGTTMTMTNATKTSTSIETIHEKKMNQALKCLIKLSNSTNNSIKSTNNLFEDHEKKNDSIFVIFGLKKMMEKTSVKPIIVSLKNSIYNSYMSSSGSGSGSSSGSGSNSNSLSNSSSGSSSGSGSNSIDKSTTHVNTPIEICLFVKDPQREYKNLLFNELDLNGNNSNAFKITKIIDISKLRKKYKEFESKRILCNSFDLFLADARVLPLLPKLLGKYFFAKKKYAIIILNYTTIMNMITIDELLPVPINLTKKSTIKSQLDTIMNAAIMHPNKGTCWSLKIGSTCMPLEKLCENVQAAIQNGIAKIPKKWDNVISIHVKTENSMALPLYQQLPDHPLKEDLLDAEMDITASEE